MSLRRKLRRREPHWVPGSGIRHRYCPFSSSRILSVRQPPSRKRRNRYRDSIGKLHQVDRDCLQQHRRALRDRALWNPTGLSSAQRLDSARYYYKLACDGVPIDTVGPTRRERWVMGLPAGILATLRFRQVLPDTALRWSSTKGVSSVRALACAELALKEYMFHHDSAEVALLRSVTVCNEGLGADVTMRHGSSVSRHSTSLLNRSSIFDGHVTWNMAGAVIGSASSRQLRHARPSTFGAPVSFSMRADASGWDRFSKPIFRSRIGR